MENVKAISERPEGTGCSLSPPHRPNWDPTPSGDYSLTFPISNWTQFGNCTLQPSGNSAVEGSGLGRPLVSIPRNRLIEKAEEDGRGDLGG